MLHTFLDELHWNFNLHAFLGFIFTLIIIGLAGIGAWIAHLILNLI